MSVTRKVQNFCDYDKNELIASHERTTGRRKEEKNDNRK